MLDEPKGGKQMEQDEQVIEDDFVEVQEPTQSNDDQFDMGLDMPKMEIGLGDLGVDF